VFVHLFDWRERPVGQIDATPGRGMRQTSLWKPGEVIHDRYLIGVASDAATQGLLSVQVGLYRMPDKDPLLATDPQGKPLGTSIAAALAKIAPSGIGSGARLPSISNYAELGGQVALLGYDLSDRSVEPGASLDGSLYWKALRRPDRDYTVFVQLLGPNGKVAQFDSQPLGRRYPTSFWDAGEEVVDPFAISLDKEVPRGEYRLIAGMYDLASGQRLPTAGSDYVDLGEVVIR